MDGKCEGCGADMTIQRTHWDGCHTTHKQCAAFKAGREAGMREAVEWAITWLYINGYEEPGFRMRDNRDYILSAIGDK